MCKIKKKFYDKVWDVSNSPEIYNKWKEWQKAFCLQQKFVLQGLSAFTTGLIHMYKIMEIQYKIRHERSYLRFTTIEKHCRSLNLPLKFYPWRLSVLLLRLIIQILNHEKFGKTSWMKLRILWLVTNCQSDNFFLLKNNCVPNDLSALTTKLICFYTIITNSV